MVAVLEQVGERRVERHLAELEPRLVGLEPADGADELDDSRGATAALEEAQRLLDVRTAQRVPAAADADERLLRRGEVGELLLAEDDVAEGELPVEGRECGRREQSARTRAEAAARRRQVDLEPAGRSKPGARQQHRDAARLEQRHRLAQEQLYLVGVELRLGGGGFVEANPVLGEQRLDLGQLPGQVAARVARAEEREDLVALLVEERRGQAQGRVVLGVQPELEHEGRPALVQVQAELPRRRGAPAEAVVEPAGQPPVQRRVAGVARQLRVGGAEPVEEELERGGTAVAQRGAEADASGLEAVARDLVDEDGVEVAHGLVAVAAERGGAGQGQRRGDPLERRLDALVERGAPERIPGAAVVLQVRVDEALGDGAVCELDDCEDRQRARARVLGRRLGQPDQLVDAEVAGSRNRPVRIAGEEGRGRVLLPDQFEHDLTG